MDKYQEGGLAADEVAESLERLFAWTDFPYHRISRQANRIVFSTGGGQLFALKIEELPADQYPELLVADDTEDANWWP
jgi:hypothetical protein